MAPRDRKNSRTDWDEDLTPTPVETPVKTCGLHLAQVVRLVQAEGDIVAMSDRIAANSEKISKIDARINRLLASSLATLVAAFAALAMRWFG